MKMNKEKLKYELKRHIADSTAMVSIATPVNAALETMVVGMTDEVSIKSRLWAAGITYAGLGSLTKIRDASKKLCGITKQSREYVKGLHDILFAGVFIVGIKPFIYLASGENDWRKIGLATLFSTLTTGAMAYPLGYAVDTYREVAGVEDSGRLPKFIEKQDIKVKRALVTSFTAGCIGLAGLVYSFNGR